MSNSKNNYGNLTTNGNVTLNGQSLAAGNALNVNPVNGSTITFTNPSPHPALTVSGETDVEVEAEGKIVITDKDGTKYDVLEFMKTVSERMLVLHPDFKKHEQYPALKEAYEHYKFLETLLMENKD